MLSEGEDSSIELLSSPVDYMAPGNLRAVARLHGITTAPLKKARILELGCASGGNLVPFAVAHPWATVVGVDISKPHIEAGEAFIKKMGLRNLELRAMDLCDITGDFGEFDYVLCHNIFSLVRPHVRAAILRICRENLSAEGVACISYNTYPGWKALDVLRDTVRLHTMDVPENEHPARARQALQFIESGIMDTNVLRGALGGLAEGWQQKPAAQILRELAPELNTPCYFGDFCEALDEYRLCYIADARPQTDLPEAYGPVIASFLKTTLPRASRERRAQYLDISAGTAFRRSIITRRSSKRRVHKTLDLSGLQKMHFALWMSPIKAPLQEVANNKHYRTRDGKAVVVVDPVAFTVVESLRQAWPSTLPFARLIEGARRFMPRRGGAPLAQAIERALMMLLRMGTLNIRLEPLPYEDRPPLKPRLIPGLANMLQHADDNHQVMGYYNLWHQPVMLPRDTLTRFLIGQINGKNTYTALRGAVRKALYSGDLLLPDGKSMAGHRSLDGKALELLLQTLQDLRRNGFII